MSSDDPFRIVKFPRWGHTAAEQLADAPQNYLPSFDGDRVGKVKYGGYGRITRDDSQRTAGDAGRTVVNNSIAMLEDIANIPATLVYYGARGDLAKAVVFPLIGGPGALVVDFVHGCAALVDAARLVFTK